MRGDGPSRGAADDYADGRVNSGDHQGGGDYEGPTVQLATAPNRRQRLAEQRAKAARRRRRRIIFVVAAAVLVLAVLGGGYAVYHSLYSVPDYDGAGTGSVVVQVDDGNSTRQIATTLFEQAVVADPRAFVKAAADDDRIRSVQPGYYQMRTHMSGASAVTLMLDPATRVGQLDIRGGVQLDDTRNPDGTVIPGVLTQIAQATCHSVDGARSCLTADDLRKAMSTTDLATLGVPTWARTEVAKADPVRRLEGLIAPGVYDVRPGASAVDVLSSLLSSSDGRMQAAGLVSGAQKIGISPYTVLTIASLVEKESITADMPKVARVVYNRLDAGQRLELDTTINYPLDVPSLYTSPENRQKPGPYNTYLNTGVPVTPIAAVGNTALAAALAPAPGPWLFFVPCAKDGTSCFAVTFAEHTANVAKARANGVF